MVCCHVGITAASGIGIAASATVAGGAGGGGMTGATGAAGIRGTSATGEDTIVKVGIKGTP